MKPGGPQVAHSSGNSTATAQVAGGYEGLCNPFTAAAVGRVVSRMINSAGSSTAMGSSFFGFRDIKVSM
jgi:hypothetical protein